MKRAICVVLSLLCLQTAIASPANTTNIRLNISGAIRDNTYFLCLPNVGCLSILAAQNGKIYTIPGQLQVDGIFVTDVDHHFRVTPEGLPASCDVTVQPNQTITISGHIHAGPNQSTAISGLRCTLSV